MEIIKHASPRIRKGLEHEVEEMVALLNTCKRDLIAQGLQQWDENYPSCEYFKEKVQLGELYILEDDRQHMAGVFVLDEHQAAEWAAADWRAAGPCLVLHALFIDPGAQGSGYGRAVLQFAEQQASARGYRSLRLDVFSENERALRFYERSGYIRTGEVTFPFKPEGHQLYYCYDKLL